MQPNDFVRRGLLPEILFHDDVGLALRISPAEAELAMLRGECGPLLVLGDRVAVLRTTFLEALSARKCS